MVEGAGVSRAPDSKRPAPGSETPPSDRERAAILDANPFLRRARVRAAQHAPQALSAGQQEHFDAFLRFYPKAHQLRRYFVRFRAMMRWRSAKKLASWIKSAAASEFQFTARLASPLRRDHLRGTSLCLLQYTNVIGNSYFRLEDAVRRGSWNRSWFAQELFGVG